MGVRSYIPSVILAVLTCSEAYLTYAFVASNHRIPDAAAFSMKTIGSSGLATLIGLAGFILSFPKIKKVLRDRGVSSNTYTALIVSILLISTILILSAILSGSAEYTQFQSMIN